ncbi:tRNA (guanine(46)-N(7))-methyltransferase TrmB [Aliikangiella sp. IMCC44653]
MYHSKVVTSNQIDLHPRLEQTVLKHIKTDYLKPYRQHNLDAFNELQNKLLSFGYRRLILDSGCGTALSSQSLAAANPEALVVGIDQSLYRLSKANDKARLPNNLLLLQANCEDIWRLCVINKIKFDEHYILYPNPWPKSIHLKRRWHGHPVFPALIKLADETIVRSNWALYLEEFSVAWFVLSGALIKPKIHAAQVPLTLFEKKYTLSGQQVYQLTLAAR